MTDQERKLVICYIREKELINPNYYIQNAELKYYCNTTAFRLYALRHAFKELFGYIADEIYRRWINFIIKCK